MEDIRNEKTWPNRYWIDCSQTWSFLESGSEKRMEEAKEIEIHRCNDWPFYQEISTSESLWMFCQKRLGIYFGSRLCGLARCDSLGRWTSESYSEFTVSWNASSYTACFLRNHKNDTSRIHSRTNQETASENHAKICHIRHEGCF